VRRGEEVELAAREVEVLEFEVTGFEGVDVSFVATVSSGTYIRSLARDVGEALGCGASLAVLRRTMNAPFGEERALVLESVRGPEDLISPWEALARMPEALVSDLAVGALRQGRAIEWEAGPVSGEIVRVAGESSPGELVAIARHDPESKLLHPVRVRPLLVGTSPGG
jgi:tRNA pseudouridine55 synthase